MVTLTTLVNVMGGLAIGSGAGRIQGSNQSDQADDLLTIGVMTCLESNGRIERAPRRGDAEIPMM